MDIKFIKMSKLFYMLLLVLNFSIHGLSQQQVWTEIGVGSNGLNTHGTIVSMVIDSDGNLYAAGALQDENFYCYVSKWDGTTWSKLGNMNLQAVIYDMVIDDQGNIFVAGGMINSDDSYFVVKWNGSTWNELKSATSTLHAKMPIYTLALDNDGNVYTVGTEEFPFGNSYYTYHVSKWNGTEWMELGAGANRLNANGRILSVNVDNSGNVYAAGQFTCGSSQLCVAKWNGTSWTELGSGLDGIQNGMDFLDDIIFDDLDNLLVTVSTPYGLNKIMKWNGSAWSQLPAQTNNYSITLAKDINGNIYSGGTFYDTTSNFVLNKFDGVNWHTHLFGKSKS